MRGIYLSSFEAIGWAVLTLPWGQGKLCTASVAWWPWPKVTEMGAKKFSHTHRSTMCGLKKLASGVFLQSWKVLAERRRRRWQQRRRRRKRTKNNKSPGNPGWLNDQLIKVVVVCEQPDNALLASHDRSLKSVVYNSTVECVCTQIHVIYIKHDTSKPNHRKMCKQQLNRSSWQISFYHFIPISPRCTVYSRKDGPVNLNDKWNSHHKHNENFRTQTILFHWCL